MSLAATPPTVPTAPGPRSSSSMSPLARLNEVLRHERAPHDLEETRAVLLEVARRKSGKLPAAWLVEQALRVSEGTDWSARRAALDALLRRVGFALRDELEIVARPAEGALFGRYALAGQREREWGGSRRRPERRPYEIDVYGVEPLAASCNCADFLRSSLGLCKHLLVVLEDIGQRRQRAGEGSTAEVSLPALRWNPVRGWTGRGDRLEGLSWHSSDSRARAAAGRPRARASSAESKEVLAALAAGKAPARLLGDGAGRTALVHALLAQHERPGVSAEPAALTLLREERDRLARLALGKAVAAEALPHLKSLLRKLYPYQREGVTRFLERQRLLLADDMGLGKTTQAIAACHALYCAGRVERGLLIVPASLKEQWLREWHATSDRAPLSAVEGNPKQRARQLAGTKRGFLVMNYEQLLRDLSAVQRFAPAMVVLDEAQRIKNWATKSSAYVTSLDPEWRLVLTGTPFENRLEELATLLDWVDDTALAPKWRLGPWHTSWASEGSSERVGARNLDTLRERLEPCLVRRVRREVLSQLPARSDVRVPVEMTGPQREEHDARVPSIARLLQIARKRPLRQPEFLALMQLLTQQRIVSNGLGLLRFDEVWPVYSRGHADDALLASSASPKLAELRRVIRQLVLEQQRKVVVFSQWRKMLKLAEWSVRDLLADAGLSSVFFTGEESQRTRSANVVAFHDEPGVRVMFLSDAGGVGLNLQHAANACINLELPWNPAVLEQRIGRIYRLGQKDPIDVINLVTEYGIEARIAGLVGNKHALFSGLFDGTTDAVRFEGPSSFVGDIERLVEPIDVPELEMSDEAAESTLDAELDLATGDSAPEPSARAADDTSALRELPATVDAAALASLDRPARSETTSLARLFASMAVTRTPEGGMRIDAPPEAAEALSQLLVGLAELLRAAEPRRG